MNRDQFLLGTWSEIPTPYVTNIIAKSGLDFSIIDMEHGVIDFELAQNMVFAAHCERKLIYIRVPEISETWVLRALDTGCDGIVFPQITDCVSVQRAVQCSLFAPQGERGFNPFIAAGNYGDIGPQYFENENARIGIIVILEGQEAFDQIDKILEISQVDVIYIGQYDLSAALGIPGDVENPLVLQTMEAAVKKIRNAGKMAGCMAQGISDANRYKEQGFNFLVFRVDSGILFQSMRTFVEGVKNNEII